MPANVETMAFAGITATDIPWHKIGTAVPRENAYGENMLAASGIDTPIGAINLYDVNGNPIAGYKGIARLTDNRIYNIMTEGYEIIQNSEVIECMQEWLTDGRMMFETIGALDHGARLWALARIGEDFKIAGKDSEVIRPYAVASWGHDGKAGITFTTCNTRVVCANTLAVAMSEGNSRVTIRHTRNARLRMKKASEGLGIVSKTLELQRQKFEELAQMKATDEIVTKTFEAVLPDLKDDATDRQKESLKRSRMDLWTVLNTSPLVALAGGTDNRWGVFNAVTEFLDHVETRKGMNMDSSNDDWQTRRVFDSFEGKTADRRQKAFDVLVTA